MMESLIKLFNEWEIQLLVLLSFTLQLFLLFTGNLRRHTSSGLVRLFIWIAFLGADLVAVYVLGLLSRQENNIVRGRQPLAFFWAPFLLIHLGGQDTITAFSMEDNNLWLRQLLNLVMHVVLAFHVFWRSIRIRHGVGLLVSGVLVFVAGIIKYGERTWCLKRGSLEGLESSTRVVRTSPRDEFSVDAADGGYSMSVREALRSMPYVLSVFSARGSWHTNVYPQQDINLMVKMGRVHLGLVYDELYTKALVLRTRSVKIFRLISQISVVVAFALFYTIVDKQGYAKADVAITYSLFIGAFFIEVCSIMLISMTSPWTWSMLKRRKWERLAKLSWLMFSSDIIGWPEKEQRWPSSIGQYNHVSWLTGSSEFRPRRPTFSQRVMALVTRVWVDLFRAKKEKIFWISKMLDPWNVDADEMTMVCVAEEIVRLDRELDGGPTREWPNLGSMLVKKMQGLERNFGRDVVNMHILTELFLSEYPPPNSDMAATTEEDGNMVRLCRELSNYMMYLLVAHPTMLPLATSSVSLLEICQTPVMVSVVGAEMDECHLQPSKETVKEMVYMWTRILLYAASKSRAEMHAARLASTGGQLITFAWLLMAFFEIGDMAHRRISIINTPDGDNTAKTTAYAFNIIATTNEHAAAGSSSANENQAS